MITIKRCLAFFAGLLTTLMCHAGDPYYVVIQNVETGEFMQYYKSGRHEAATFFSKFSSDSPSDDDVKNALWIKSSLDGGGISLQNVGKTKDSYLNSSVGTSGIWKGYYEDCYSSTATTFYLFPNPYNEKGYAVSYSSTGSNDNQKCWYVYSYNNLYYLCSTESTSLNTISNGDGYYHLSTFRFLSFKDLYDQATILGASLSFAVGDSVKDSQPVYANYATLVNDIASALSKRANSPEVFSTEMFIPEKTVYPNILLRNQRFGTYLAMDPAGKLYMTDVINTDCVWTANDINHAKRQYAFFCYGNGKPLTIYYKYGAFFNKRTGSQSTLTLYKSDEADTTMAASYPSGYFRISGLINNETVYLLTNGKDTIESTSYKASKNTDPLWVEDADWEAVPYDMTDNLENLAVREDNLQDSLFYRIENQGYALAGRSSGWLSYDDHVDMRGVKAAAPYLSDLDAAGSDPNKIYAFSVQKAKIKPGKSKGKASANTLWHLILKAKKTESDGQPIGIIGTHDNNLYVIKNANAMQYLALPNYKDGDYEGTTIGTNTYYYMRTTPDASQAALFWLEDLGKGQYAIAVRDPHNSAESDNILGYLRILDDGTGTGSGNIGYFRAALILDKNTTKPSATTNGAWSLLQATFVHAKTATAQQAEDIKLAKKLWGDEKGANGFRYVTAYYPFNIAPTNEDVKVFKGIEYPNDNHVYFKDVNAAVPAFNGALIMVPNTDEHNYIELSISPCAPGSGFDGNVLKGTTLSETGPIFGSEYSTGEDATITAKRNNYYIFTTDTYEDQTVQLSLMHPADAWLMANRVYIPNTTASQAKMLPIRFLLDGETTFISPVHYRSALDSYWYDLSGQRVMQPAHGLFIHNGKKILVK